MLNLLQQFKVNIKQMENVVLMVLPDVKITYISMLKKHLSNYIWNIW